MAELAYLLTTALLLGLLALLLFQGHVAAWVERTAARIERLTATVDAATARLNSDEWANASPWEALTGRRNREGPR